VKSRFCPDLDAFIDESGVERGSDEIAYIAGVVGEAKHFMGGDIFGDKAVEIWFDI
jgi:hypothetical protein